MINTVHKISSYLFIVLGIIHTSVTPLIIGRFSLNALWFAGSGLAMLFAGFLNIVLSRSIGQDDRFVRILCYITNITILVFGATIIKVLREPQAIIGLLLIVIMNLTAFKLKRVS